MGRERPRRDPLRMGIAVPGVALAAAGSALAGFAIGSPWILPALNAAPAWTVMALLVRRGRRGAAVGLMLWWAAWLGASTMILSAADPFGTASRAVLNGPEYLTEMRSWIESGVGCESTPSCFVPRHLLHEGIYVVLALLTGSAAAILMGAWLLNYMAFYVGALAASSASPLPTVLLAWVPWSLVRIAGFVTLGVVLSEPLLHRWQGTKAPPGRGRYLIASAGCLVLDLVMKAIMAQHWPGILRHLLHG